MNRFFWTVPTFPYDCILSARSDDGLVWNREDGVRLNVDDLHNSVQVYYPKVVKYKKGWRLYYRAGGRRAGIASAFSKDGLSWIVEGGMRIASDQCETIFERVESCDVTILENNNWQMYFSAFDGHSWRIYRSNSFNGLNWQGCKVVIDMSSEGYLPDVKAPCVIRNKNEFRMYYTRFSKSESRIFTSHSDDGINWLHSSECEDLCGGNGFIYNPNAMKIADGGIRMYFTERPYASSPLGARVYSAISYDSINWKRENGVRIGPGAAYDRHGIFNVDIVPIDSGYRMYYTGYWGRHLLEPLTLHYYRKKTKEAVSKK